MKKNRFNFKKSISVAILAFMIGILSLLTSCGGSAGNGNMATSENITYITVETPYCDLKYPDEFADDIEVKKDKKDNCYFVKFYTHVGKKKVEIYNVQFGDGYGEYIGKITDDKDETVEVYVDFGNVDGIGLKASEMDIVYATQETVNDVILSITESPDFTE